MRTIEEIKTDMSENNRSQLANRFERSNALITEFLYAVTDEITLDRLQEICNAERDGRLVDAQELYNRLKVAEFDKLFLEIEDYAEGYNKAIRDVTCFLLWEYGVKPLSKEQAEQALKGGA